MNIREENEQLREKIDNYEQILEKVMVRTYKPVAKYMVDRQLAKRNKKR